MNRIWAAVLLYLVTLTPAFAVYTPFYAGLQLDNTSGTALLGYQINKMYAVEANYTQSDSSISHASINADTKTIATGLAALVMFPLQLTGGSPYFLFAKAGYERLTKEETYSIPSSITTTVPYSDTISSSKNQAIWGGGVQYDFYQSLSGRAGIDIVGDKRSVYIAAIFKF
jgi:opacity protein-like surface antigen